MINENRLINEFYKLISIDSPSYFEDDVAFYLFDKLKDLGLEVYMDNAIKTLTNRETKAGNIYGYLKGNISGDAILFSSHMDTVEPSKSKKAIRDGNIIKSSGNTVLGADDMTGVASILEMLSVIKENNLSHPDIEVVFFVAEELFCKGSSVFDYSILKSKIAYVFDLSEKPYVAAIEAPSIYSFEVEIYGKASHAGFEPEKGISSILISSLAISKLKLGRIDDETTLNIGLIDGGSGKNIVPEKTIIKGEIRSLDHKKVIDLLDNINYVFDIEAKKLNGSIKFSFEENIRAYKVSLDEHVIKHYINTLNKLGVKNPKFITTFGGSDNNNFNKNGIKGIVVSNAMYDIHTKGEYFLVDEFIKSAKLCLALALGGNDDI